MVSEITVFPNFHFKEVLDLNKSLSQTDYGFLNKYNENLKSQSSDSFNKYKVTVISSTE